MSSKKMTKAEIAREEQLSELRSLAEQDLRIFAKLVNPNRVYGQIHLDTFKWWMDCEKDGIDSTCLLLPRDHQKSHCAAVKAAWLITRDPSRTIMYVSATSALAEKQLKAIKDILLSDTYSEIWPDMVHPEEGKREKWTSTEIAVDHPKRKEEGVRDSTVFAAGLTTNITGFHATDTFQDDVVVPNNAFTEEGRSAVRSQYSQLASIATTGASETIVGTKYHPADLYSNLLEMTEPIIDDDGDIVGERNVYEFKIEVVEVNGKFLWPKEARADGKTFGFDMRELVRKKAKYLDTVQFYAQYYQETNDPDSHRLKQEDFQYYDQRHLRMHQGRWHFGNQPLNVFAGIDFAYSLSKKADFTAIVVIGVDPDFNIYILDIDRFKADRISAYYDAVLEAHIKWGFRKLRGEVTAAQSIIVNDLKDLFRKNGNAISVDEHRPNRHQGKKEERIEAVLMPRYDNKAIWHFKGGYTAVLEEELRLQRPPHDDVKDCLASVVEIAKPPRASMLTKSSGDNVVKINSRFGGVAFR